MSLRCIFLYLNPLNGFVRHSAYNRICTTVDFFSLEELPSKVRSLVRNVKKVEAELVALKISYLKKVNKGSNIVILDS